jgi:hypothetical protein
MTQDERQKLRDATIAALNATGFRWEVQTSNSFRRIGCHGDGDVLCGIKHPIDGHPDLLAPRGVLDYVVAVQPRVVLDLLDYLDMIEKRLEHFDEVECQLLEMRGAVEKALKAVFR